MKTMRSSGRVAPPARKTTPLGAAIATCLCLGGCGSGSPQAPAPAADTGPAAMSPAQQGAIDLAGWMASNCPWPANLDQYASTTIAPRSLATHPVQPGLLRGVTHACAIMTFTVDETGLITGSQLLSANPPAFAAAAPKILRWNNFASGAASDTAFIVRLGGASLPDGGAMTTLGFTDSTINLEVPP